MKIVIVTVIVNVVVKLYRCTCLYIIPSTLSVYNMLMQLVTFNTSGKALITIANRNQHYEASQIKNRLLRLKVESLK